MGDSCSRTSSGACSCYVRSLTILHSDGSLIRILRDPSTAHRRIHILQLEGEQRIVGRTDPTCLGTCGGDVGIATVVLSSGGDFLVSRDPIATDQCSLVHESPRVGERVDTSWDDGRCCRCDWRSGGRCRWSDRGGRWQWRWFDRHGRIVRWLIAGRGGGYGAWDIAGRLTRNVAG